MMLLPFRHPHTWDILISALSLSLGYFFTLHISPALWINQNSIKSPHYFPLWSAMAAFNYYPRQGVDIRQNRMIIIRTNLNESLGWQTDIGYNYVFFICCPCHIFWLLRRSMQWNSGSAATGVENHCVHLLRSGSVLLAVICRFWNYTWEGDSNEMWSLQGCPSWCRTFLSLSGRKQRCMHCNPQKQLAGHPCRDLWISEMTDELKSYYFYLKSQSAV